MEKDNLNTQAHERLSELSTLIGKIETILKTSSKDKIWCKQRGNAFQYYKIGTGKKPARTYIRKKNIEIAKKGIQAEYYSNILPVLVSLNKSLKTFARHYDFQKIEKVYKKMPIAKQRLITPIFIDNETYAKQWQSKSYEHKLEQPDKTLITMKKEAVRSKSELIIANLLNTNGIPYHYEYPVQIYSDVILHPDFFCLNKRTCQEFYWEHCGKMDDPDYSKKLVRRLSLYARKNILPGKNLILTMETTDQPLNIKDLEKIISCFLF